MNSLSPSPLSVNKTPIINGLVQKLHNLTSGRISSCVVILSLAFISSTVVGFILTLFISLPNTSSPPILSPQPEILPAQIEQPDQAGLSDFTVLGFLPFWRLNEIETLYLDSLTDIAYFSLSIDRLGNFQKTDADGFLEPGWGKFRSDLLTKMLVRSRGRRQKIIITLALMDRGEIIAFLDSPSSQNNLIINILALVKAYQINGVNIDFEYSGLPPAQTISNFTQFIQKLKQALNRLEFRIELSIDAHADSLIRTRLQDIESLVNDVDYIIVMAYDFFRISSAYSGPVAPLNAGAKYDYSVTQAVKDFLAVAPANKLILGIPFYGYEWQTVSTLVNSQTIDGSGAIASYKRVKTIINEQCPSTEADCQLAWDETASSPYLIYQPDPYSIRQIYYENEESISAKIALARENNLSGIAFWALGYDGADPSLWSTINQALNE